MQESDDGFTSYMAARWPTLVRSLVTLGCEPHEAEDVAQSALLRCYASWERVCRADDLDAYVFRTMLNVWNKNRRRRWWWIRSRDGDDGDTGDDSAGDRSDSPHDRRASLHPWT